MPELPEVERVRLSLLDHLIGRRVAAVTVRRAEIVERVTGQDAPLAAALLVGQTIRAIIRHGKQLAIVASTGDGGQQIDIDDDDPAICVHLGMTGSLTYQTEPPAKADAKHTHLVWRLDSPSAGRPAGGTNPAGHLLFDDPRRFGGVWTFARFGDLKSLRWSALGHDALRITPGRLFERLRATQRGLKAVLLDQQVVAGLGNIYVDELLFEMGLHPMTPARRLPMNTVQQMVPRMRRLLRRAIASGGSSLRNYVDGNGAKGAFQLRHQVYGRGGEACLKCAGKLRTNAVAGRTTVWCGACQRRR